MELKCVNINDAFHKLVSFFQRFIREGNDIITKTTSRNGSVWQVAEPVTVTYVKPDQRVLFNRARNANPFFHLYEALWMLAGRRDVAPLKFYNSKIDQFSDDGETFNGAYGYRWRHAKDGGVNIHEYPAGEYSAAGIRTTERRVDQLSIIANHLKALPDSRRAVLDMWNVEDDLLKIGNKETTTENSERWKTFEPASKDVCCNLSVMFSIRLTRDREEHEDSYSNPDEWLDMTVVNRSNDMIWGMLGANYVHFSILQEYIAAKIGVGVGKYSHFTNNLHVYDWNWKPEEWMKEYSSRNDWRDNLTWYEANEVTKSIPLVNDIQAFDKELPEVVRLFDGTIGLQDMIGLTKTSETIARLTEPFFKYTAAPMFVAWAMQKLHTYDLARYWCSQIKSPDWRKACSDWIHDKENGKVQSKS